MSHQDSILSLWNAGYLLHRHLQLNHWGDITATSSHRFVFLIPVDIFLLCISGFHQALKLTVILLPLPPGYWDYRQFIPVLLLSAFCVLGSEFWATLASFSLPYSVISKQDSSCLHSLCLGAQRMLKMTMTVDLNSNTSLAYRYTWKQTKT